MDRHGLRILTFNWREPYICMLAQTGLRWLFVFQSLLTRQDWGINEPAHGEVYNESNVEKRWIIPTRQRAWRKL
jgi:hypothetical protein